jgi:hypothetical protein
MDQPSRFVFVESPLVAVRFGPDTMVPGTKIPRLNRYRHRNPQTFAKFTELSAAPGGSSPSRLCAFA